MTRFTDLPEDVILPIGEQIEHERDLNSLARTSSALFGLFNRKLYSDHVRFHGSWALTWAAEHDRVDTAKRLLAAGADVLARTADRESLPPIVVAAKNNSLAMVKLLCETEGVDPDWTEGITPPALVWAVQMGFDKMTAHLLADPRVDPQRRYAYVGSDGNKMAETLIIRDALVDPATLGLSGLTALSFAAGSEGDRAGAIRLLVADPRVDPHHADSNGYTALTQSVASGHRENLRALLDAGLDANHRDAEGTPALCLAAGRGRLHAVELLLGHSGIDVNMGDSVGSTALMYSMFVNNTYVVGLLLDDRRVLVNVANDEGETALVFAASASCAELDLILSAPGVDFNHGVEEGRCAVDRAIDTGSVRCLEVLLEDERLDLAALNGRQPSLILYAAQLSYGGILRALCLDGRFTLDDVDDMGRNALSYAVERHNEISVEVLLETAERMGLTHRMNIEDNSGLTPLGRVKRGPHKKIFAGLLNRFLTRNELQADFIGSSSRA